MYFDTHQNTTPVNKKPYFPVQTLNADKTTTPMRFLSILKCLYQSSSRLLFEELFELFELFDELCSFEIGVFNLHSLILIGLGK